MITIPTPQRVSPAPGAFVVADPWGVRHHPDVRTSVDPGVGRGFAVLGRRADDADPAREAYRLTVTPTGAEVVGASPEGVFRGLTTLLHEAVAGGGSVPCGVVEDAPRLAWRGLSLDVVRTFHPVDTVRRVVDLLAHYKLNVLHLHLTDAEGWRLEVPARPELTDVGAAGAASGRAGGHYSTAEFADLVAYAAERFVTIVPEFDSPGHSTALLAARPELVSERVRGLPRERWYLDPDHPGVLDQVAEVFGAFAAVTRGGRLHVGADEALLMGHELYARYLAAVLPLARATGRGIVAWQEASRAGCLVAGDIVQWWIPAHLVDESRTALADASFVAAAATDPMAAIMLEFARLFAVADEDVPHALAQGSDVLLSPATQLYLDTRYPEPAADPRQEERRSRVGMAPEHYASGTVEDAFAWDPLELGVPAERIAGVEAAVWCETVEDADDLFFLLLPRLAGVAEKGWSPPSEWAGHRARLRAQGPVWDALGLTWFRSSAVWDD